MFSLLVLISRGFDNIGNLHCAVIRKQYYFPGGYSGEETPVPIPNTEVKLPSADGTARVTSWESRTLPGLQATSEVAFF